MKLLKTQLMKYILVFILAFIFDNVGISQCMQRQSNSLFSCATLLSFTGGVEQGEEKLLQWDFCYIDTVKSINNKIKYYRYRIDHTLNYNTSKYQFDIFSITNDADRFGYCTSSNKNFIGYKKKLMDFGFTRISEDFYKKQVGARTYYMTLDRDAHSSGTANYHIYIFY